MYKLFLKIILHNIPKTKLNEWKGKEKEWKGKELIHSVVCLFIGQTLQNNRTKEERWEKPL